MATHDLPEIRMMRESRFDYETGCWRWTGEKLPKGYGLISVNSNKAQVHRVAAALWLGFDRTSSAHVMHTCDQPDCFNPSHLRIGTNDDNVQDRNEKGRTARGEDAGPAKLTHAQVIDIKLRLLNGARQKDVAAAFGISKQTISDIGAGRTWGHVLVTLEETASVEREQNPRSEAKALFRTRTGDPLLTMQVEDDPDEPELAEISGDSGADLTAYAWSLLPGASESDGTVWSS